MYNKPDFLDIIVRRLKERDETALQYLYEHYAAALNGIISRTLGDEQLAEEALHDVFIKIWEQIEKFDPSKGKLFTWMYRIARNYALDVRRSKNFKLSEKSIELDSYVNTFATNNKERESGLKEMVGLLSEECFKLINMNFFMGFSHGDISKELAMPLGSVKTKIRNCMSKLRTLMGQKND